MAKKIGRNAPCPCGSGKKYKHCCLHRDEHRATEKRRRRQEQFSQQEQRAPYAAPAWPAREPPASPQGLDELIPSLRQAIRLGTPEMAAELRPLLERLEKVAHYQEKEPEIEAAAQELELHRAEFDALLEKEEAFFERARRLFAEPDFQAFRCTAKDVYHAFEAVGYPLQFEGPGPENTEILLQALLHLADWDRRKSLSRQLMLLLPEYVRAGRYLDAWLVQHSAFLTLQAPHKSNPFLAEMFQYGFGEWARQVDRQREQALGLLGLDREKYLSTSIDQFEALLEEQMRDPQQKARVEAYFQEHPLLNAQAERTSGPRKRFRSSCWNGPTPATFTCPGRNYCPGSNA